MIIDYDIRDHPVFRPIAPLTEEENARYVSAYRELADYIDDAHLHFVLNECDDLIKFIVELGQRCLRERTIVRVDERGSSVRDVVAARTLSATNSFTVYRDQRRIVAEELARSRGDDTLDRYNERMKRLYRGCWGYRWILELRNALLHLSLNAVSFSISVSDDGPKFTLNMRRSEVEKTNNMNQARNAEWLRELQAMSEEPSVFDMLEQAHPALGQAHSDLREILYPEPVRVAAAGGVSPVGGAISF
ncbi:hypothetical protein ACNHUS_36295 [Actinomycetes bacterium M1A6_2h]